MTARSAEDPKRSPPEQVPREGPVLVPGQSDATTQPRPGVTVVERIMASLQDEVAGGDISLDVALQWVVQEAAVLSGADGIALALASRDGTIVCRASIGCAPGVGVALRPDVGLSGECIRSRSMVYAPDTEADQRVDREAAKVLGSRSVLILPVMNGETLAGVLELFAARAHAFDLRMQARMSRLTALLGTVLASEGRPAVPAQRREEAAEHAPSPTRSFNEPPPRAETDSSLEQLRRHLTVEEPEAVEREWQWPRIMVAVAVLILLLVLVVWWWQGIDVGNVLPSDERFERYAFGRAGVS